MTPLEAAIAELERQSQEVRNRTPFVDADDPKFANIDGHVDLEKLVEAVLAHAPVPAFTFDDLPWRDGRYAPEDGTKIAGLHSMKFTRYKPGSEQVKRRGPKAGRWQRAGEYGGWENCDPPERWLPHP